MTIFSISYWHFYITTRHSLIVFVVTTSTTSCLAGVLSLDAAYKQNTFNNIINRIDQEKYTENTSSNI